MKKEIFSNDSWNELLKSVNEKTTTNEQLMAYGIVTFFIKMPSKVHGYVERYCDTFGDVFLIYINENLSVSEQWKSLKHEILHILRNDFDTYCSVNVLEELVREAV